MPTSSSSNNKIITIPFTNESYTKIEITRLLLKLLPRETHHLHIKKKYCQKVTYNCFKATNAVSILKSHFHFSNTYDVIQFGRELQRYNIIHCICHDEDEEDIILFGDDNTLFRLQPFHTPHVLNTFILINDNTKLIKSTKKDDDGSDAQAKEQNQDNNREEGVFELIHKLYNQMQIIEQESKDKNENINYTKLITNNPNYDKLEEDICQLQNLSLQELLHDTEKILAFFINVYNILIKYAFWKVGIPISAYQRHAFYDSISININGYILSLNYIYHTILRCNNNTQTTTSNTNHKLSIKLNQLTNSITACTSYLTATTTQENILQKLTLNTLDPRIHFALLHTPIPISNIPYYTYTMIYDQLQTTTIAFCEQFKNVFVDEDSFHIHLSMIFKWYRNDFVGDRTEIDFLEQVLLSYLHRKKSNMLRRIVKKQREDDIDIVIKYMPFDWDYCNGVSIINKKVFDKDSVLSERLTLLGKMNSFFSSKF